MEENGNIDGLSDGHVQFDNSENYLDLEPLEDLDDAEFGLPPVDQPPSLEDILAADENDELDDIFEEEADTVVTGNGHVLLTENSNYSTGYNANNSGSSSLGAGSTSSGQSALLRHLGIFSGSGNNEETLSIHSRGSHNLSRTSVTESLQSSILLHNKKRLERSKASIMRHVILKGISSQLSSARERVNAGLPTAMAASSSMIAIGTSHGLVLVFDGLQKLKYSLGAPLSTNSEKGAVSSLAFNQTNPSDGDLQLPTRLLVGFAKGHVVEYDMTTGKILRTLDDAHPLGSAVTHVRFTDDPSLALICDSGGSVFELSFKRTLGIRGYDSRCIFSGSRGEVCTLEPLSIVSQYPNHRLSDRSIVALATISKVIVLTIRPSMKVLFTHPLVGKSNTLPLLGWQFVIIQMSKESKVIDPVIAFGRQSTLHFFQLSEDLSGKLVFIPLQNVELPYQLLNFGWLNTRCLGILDTSEVFHLYDVRNHTNIEEVDLSDNVELCYGSSFFKGLATGGNVSAAMVAAGEKATYGSLLTFTNQLLLLGRKTFHVLVIRTWSERLEYLVKWNRHLEALQLGAEIYQDQGKALVGLRGPKEKRKTVISRKMTSILINYISNVAFTKQFPEEGNISVLQEYFDKIVPPCINLCMIIRNKELLFTEVWDSFSIDPFGKATFLESLESYILSDQLRNLPVPICKEFVKHYESCEKFIALEACLTHFNITSLDIHQVMNICSTHGLYDAIIYIYNNGMMDFVTPAEDFLSQLILAMNDSQKVTNRSETSCTTDKVQQNQDNLKQVHPKNLSERQIRLGNKLLVYISCCLAGRAYPYGDIPEEMVAQVKYDVYSCITAIHSKRAPDNEESYPYLKSLLHFDTQGLFNVISIAFEEPEFNSDLGKCQKQRLVDILLQIMVNVDHESNAYTPSQIAHLFTFLARQIAKGDDCGLSVSRDLFEKVLNVLTSKNSSSGSVNHEECQQALLDMLNAGGMQYFEKELLERQASLAGFHRILEMLYENDGQYEKILNCYLNDPLRDRQAFAFAQKVFIEADYDLETAKKGSVEKSILKELNKLLNLDIKKTAMVIYHHMHPYIPLVIEKLEQYITSKSSSEDSVTCSKQLFEFIGHLLEYKESGSQPNTPTHEKSESTSKSLNDAHIKLQSAEIYERYIELMCSFDPKALASYLRSKGTGIPYTPKKVLELCKKHNLTDAEAYVLEQDGKLEEAFNVIKRTLDQKMDEIVAGHCNVHDNDANDMSLAWSYVNTMIILLIQLCQKHHSKDLDIPSSDKDKIWFDLLESIIKPQRVLSNRRGIITKSQLQPFKDAVKHVVNSALGYVSLRNLIETIVTDQVYQVNNHNINSLVRIRVIKCTQIILFIHDIIISRMIVLVTFESFSLECLKCTIMKRP